MSGRTRPWPVLLSTILVLALGACSGGGTPPGSGGIGDPCVNHPDCVEGLFCSAAGVCYDPSSTDGDADTDSDSDQPSGCVDQDGDGHSAISTYCPSGDDCDDDDPRAYPGREESCADNVDNNCDGVVDEPTCLCARGQTRSCYTGPDGTAGRGGCQAGQQLCGADQSWGECLGERLPEASDTCGNMIDDDCDGRIDEDCECDPGCLCDDEGAGPDCECSPPTNQPCYSGPPSTGSTGECTGGRRDCLDTGGGVYRWGDCEGEVLPVDEVCADGLDQDCDGLVDDGCGPLPDGDGDGYSVVDGDCDDNDAERHPGATEACNGFDDDCDGDVDEGCSCTSGATQSCFSGPPANQDRAPCQPGLQTCEGGAEFSRWGECVGEVLPSLEVCDEVDNDCDGEVDEGAIDANGCGDCVFAETVCDGEDDDCDGLVDEGLVNACGLCPPEPCFTEPYEEPGDCEDFPGRLCDGTGPVEDDPTAITLTQGSIRTPLIYLAVNSLNEVAQLDTNTGAKNWQAPSWGSRPSRTSVAWDYSVWVGNRCYDGDYNDPNCSNTVHLAREDGAFICRADTTGIARGLAIDGDGYVWTGTWASQELYRIDPDDCVILDVINIGVNVYGLAIDGDGYLWTASNSGSMTSMTARVNTRDLTDITYIPNPARYGITVDTGGNVWMGDWSGGGGVHRFSPPDWSRTNASVTGVTGVAFAAEALAGPSVVAPGPEGIWGSQYGINRVTHIDPLTMAEACSAPISCNDGSGYGGSCANPHGVAALADGTIWVPIRFGGFVDVFDRNCNLLHVYEVDAGQELYTYSDMAGTQLMTVTTRTGHWIQSFDSGYDDPFWSSVSWTANPLPPETGVNVTVVGAETEAGLTSAPSAPCGPFGSIEGANEAPLGDCAAIQGLRWVQVDLEMTTTRNEIRPVVHDVNVNWAY